MDELISDFIKIKLDDDKLDELCVKLDEMVISKDDKSIVSNDEITELCSSFMTKCAVNKCSKEKVLSVMNKIFFILLMDSTAYS